MSRVVPLFCLVVMSLAIELNGQKNGEVVTSRAEQIQAERIDKAAALVPVRPRRTERLFNKVKDGISWVLNPGPIRLQGGGLPSGTGLALGPLLEWRNRADEIRLGLGAVGSVRSYYAVGAGLLLPNFADRRLSVAVDGAYSYAPTLDYYGPGPDSLKGGRTEYLEEDTSLDLRIRWRPPRQHVSTGFELGALFVNVGPGTSSHIATTPSVYSPSEAPGVDVQSDFFRAGYFIDFDYRDVFLEARHYGDTPPTDSRRFHNISLDARQGTRVTLGYQQYFDLVHDRYSFGRLLADAEYYQPFFNRKRVLALRVGTELSYHAGDQVVPFYLQPTLGGPYDNRGFRRYRFYDENLIRLNAEYRWEVSYGFDMALFGDAGKVFNKPGQINLSNLESSAGFGLRFRTPKSAAMRIDTGFSHEGFQTWVQFNYFF